MERDNSAKLSSVPSRAANKLNNLGKSLNFSIFAISLTSLCKIVVMYDLNQTFCLARSFLISISGNPPVNTFFTRSFFFRELLPAFTNISLWENSFTNDSSMKLILAPLISLWDNGNRLSISIRLIFFLQS